LLLGVTVAGQAEESFSAAFEKAKNVEAVNQVEVLSRLGNIAADNPDDRKAFTDYLATLDNAKARSDIGSVFVRRLAVSNLEAAVQYVEEWNVEGKDDVSHALALQWAQTEPEKAIEWQLAQGLTTY